MPRTRLWKGAPCVQVDLKVCVVETDGIESRWQRKVPYREEEPIKTLSFGEVLPHPLSLEFRRAAAGRDIPGYGRHAELHPSMPSRRSHCTRWESKTRKTTFPPWAPPRENRRYRRFLTSTLTTTLISTCDGKHRSVGGASRHLMWSVMFWLQAPPPPQIGRFMRLVRVVRFVRFVWCEAEAEAQSVN